MKTIGGMAALAAVACVLTACGSGGNDGTSSSDSGSPAASSSSVDSYPTGIVSSDPPSPTEPAGPQTLAIGEGLSVSSTPDEEDQGAAGSATIKVTKVFTAKVEPGEFGSKPDHGLFVVVRVLATGESGAVDFNPLDFYLSTSEGDHYEDPTYSDAWGPDFSSGTVHGGERLRGTIVYDVSKTARTGAVYYSPNRDEQPLATWRYR